MACARPCNAYAMPSTFVTPLQFTAAIVLLSVRRKTRPFRNLSSRQRLDSVAQAAATSNTVLPAHAQLQQIVLDSEKEKQKHKSMSQSSKVRRRAHVSARQILLTSVSMNFRSASDELPQRGQVEHIQQCMSNKTSILVN